MYSSVVTHTRGQQIDVGNAIGAMIKEFDRKNPWIIHIGGDCSGGKGLIALAMDQALNPERYTEGIIPLADSPDIKLNGVKLNGKKNGEYPVVFHNFNHVPAHTITTEGLVRSTKRSHVYDPAEAGTMIKTGFDWLLSDLRDKHPGAHVLVAANIRREDHAREKHHHGLRSDMLDISMEVTGSSYNDAGGSFDRKIEIICRDEKALTALMQKLQEQGAVTGSLTQSPPLRSDDWWINPSPARFTQPQA